MSTGEDQLEDETAAAKSRVGESIEAGLANWTFSGDVAKKFSEHVRRSVPLYDEGHDLVCRISDYFLANGSLCYEIGVSTGALTRKLAERHAERGVRFVGMDIEKTMIEQARLEVGDAPGVDLVVADANAFEFDKADLIIAYYTVQFIPPRVRQDLINRIYEALNWGGCFLMFEKVRAPDARFQDICTGLYLDYKLEKGYSPDEIVGKSRSLKGVLEPFSTQGNLDLMTRAGFVDILTVMKYVPFEGFMAIK